MTTGKKERAEEPNMRKALYFFGTLYARRNGSAMSSITVQLTENVFNI